MNSFIEYLKQFPRIKKIGKKVLLLRECYFRLIADEEFYSYYKKNFLTLPDCNDGVMSLEDLYIKGNLRILSKPLLKYYDDLVYSIDQKVTKKEGYVVMRVGDGEANFLNAIVKGNTASRHFTTGSKPNAEYLKKFKDGLLECDSIHVEMNRTRGLAFRSIYGKNIFSPIPLECVYALIASRQILKSNYKIGIIGADNKITLIKKLFEHKEYCDYIGRNSFEQYISVPERGSSNNIDELLRSISKELDPSIDIYLVGIGIAKMALLAKLKNKSNAVFLDVGCGISALAGLISNERPYFADWINFRLKDFDYTGIDVMDADMGKGGKIYL